MDKWKGSVSAIVCAPIQQVWKLISVSSSLPDWMPMVDICRRLAGEDGVPGYVRLVSGSIFPHEDGDGKSWIKEKLILMDNTSFRYVYRLEESNIVGLDGSVNSLKLTDYGDGCTLVEWMFAVDEMQGVSMETIIDYLGFLYRSCINRIESVLKCNINQADSKTPVSS